jgi:hypothetical protein
MPSLSTARTYPDDHPQAITLPGWGLRSTKVVGYDNLGRPLNKHNQLISPFWFGQLRGDPPTNPLEDMQQHQAYPTAKGYSSSPTHNSESGDSSCQTSVDEEMEDDFTDECDEEVVEQSKPPCSFHSKYEDDCLCEEMFEDDCLCEEMFEDEEDGFGATEILGIV